MSEKFKVSENCSVRINLRSRGMIEVMNEDGQYWDVQIDIDNIRRNQKGGDLYYIGPKAPHGSFNSIYLVSATKLAKWLGEEFDTLRPIMKQNMRDFIDNDDEDMAEAA